MSVELWQQCVELLRDELPAQQFNTWIRPLQVEAEGDELRVYAPNRFVLDWVNESTWVASSNCSMSTATAWRLRFPY